MGTVWYHCARCRAPGHRRDRRIGQQDRLSCTPRIQYQPRACNPRQHTVVLLPPPASGTEECTPGTHVGGVCVALSGAAWDRIVAVGESSLSNQACLAQLVDELKAGITIERSLLMQPSSLVAVVLAVFTEHVEVRGTHP